ncbi:HTH-type transcriptional activator RhaS [Paenibacillus sp. JJ-100]|uniref:AraC family transcriptional regulator n=1 Tax=Paenibacillus sp. JJ-100 TaxID=2974896 RepID=UPI0022FF5322|nr:AraC family transcriptional regulator [Paenibacillus sp. JJ-100]CAI6043512.1 HTH-type transcriptional activator RhaS [Paenibacillus sp. JJ-100]
MGVPTFLETGHMADGFPIRLIYTGAQFDYAAHWHDEVELVVVNGQHARIGVNEQMFDLQQGDMILIKPGDVHYFMPGTERLTILLFRLELLTGSFASEAEMQEMGRLFNQSMIIPFSSVNNPTPYVEAIAAEKKNQKPGYRWLMVSRLYDLIVLLLRTAPPVSEKDAKPSWPCVSSKKFEFLESVCEFLEDHYAESIKLEQVAEHMKFSKFHICKLFKEIKGITLMEYLNHFRIIKSEWALLFRQDSILEIAISHGFNNVNSYNRLFKKYNQCTPTEFRKRHRSDITKYQG